MSPGLRPGLRPPPVFPRYPGRTFLVRKCVCHSRDGSRVLRNEAKAGSSGSISTTYDMVYQSKNVNARNLKPAPARPPAPFGKSGNWPRPPEAALGLPPPRPSPDPTLERAPTASLGRHEGERQRGFNVFYGTKPRPCQATSYQELAGDSAGRSCADWTFGSPRGPLAAAPLLDARL